MSIELVLIIILLFILIVLLLLLFKKLNNSSPNQTLLQWLNSTQQSQTSNNSNIINSLNLNNKSITDTLQNFSQTLDKRLDSTIGIISKSTEELTKMNQIGQSIRDLQGLLQSPKLRGNLGEEILSDMLAQIFPKESYKLQFAFKSGARVDAIIKTNAGLLPIDAKFPLENYQKLLKCEEGKAKADFKKQFLLDVKKHIKDISQKYILVSEGTVDFAFMYVPSEAIFLEIAEHPELMQFARSLRVYPVSPNTLYAHLQTVLLSFEGFRIEKNAKKILELLKSLQKDYNKTFDSVQILGRHLTNASSQYSNTFSQFTLMGQKLQNQELLEDGES